MRIPQTQSVGQKLAYRFRAALLLLGVLLIGSATSSGQDGQRTRGFYPGGSYAVSDIDTVNTKNGNLMLAVPLASLPSGRAGLKAGISLFYDSKIFDTFTYRDGRYPDGPDTTELTTSQDGGWRYGFDYELQLVDRHSVNQDISCNSPEATYIYQLKMRFPDGSVHILRPQGATDGQADDYFRIRPDGWLNTACQGDAPFWNGPITYYSADGTFLRLDIQHDSDNVAMNNPWTLYLPDGGRVTGGGTAFQRIYDRNNNYVEIQNIAYNGHPSTRVVDQMNRYIILEHDTTGNDYVHTWRSDEYGQLTELISTIKWGSAGGARAYYGNTNDVGIGSVFYAPGGGGVTEIDLPAQSGGISYKFGYDPSSNWGEISSVTLPSGAKVSYQYTWYDVMWSNALKVFPSRKDLVYRPEYDLAPINSTPCNPQTESCITDSWLFSYTFAGYVMSAHTTAPDGGITSDYFFGTDVNPSIPPFNPVFKSERPDGTMVETLWQTNYPYGSNLSRLGINPYAKTTFTTIKNATGQYTKTQIKDYNYDKNGNVTRMAEYDWVDYSTIPHDGYGVVTGIPGGATIKRVTTSVYYNSTPDASDSTTNNTNEYSNALSPQLRTAIQASEINDGAQTFARTEFTYDNPTTTGNLVQKASWDSTKGGYSNPLSTGNSISVSNQYDSYGNLTLSTDPRNYQTQLTYGNVGGFTDLYATQTKTAFNTSVQRTETRDYDFYSGLATRVTDVDNNVSTATTYDVFERPKLIKAADGKVEETRTAMEYSDTLRRIITRSDFNSLGDGRLVKTEHYDQLGRIRLARQLEDSTTQSATDESAGIKVETRYQFSGSNSYVLTSNPYRAGTSSAASIDPTMGWTRSKSDNGGRVIEVQTFSGTSLPAPWGGNANSTGTITTAYDANFTTVTDQTARVRRSLTNSLGQLARVDEPDGGGNLGSNDSPTQPTTYSYDVLGNLVTVNQGSQARSFVYSSLARLISGSNPESGPVSYQYDNNGNLTRKTDARGVVTTFGVYDALNRPTTKSYSDGTPMVTYSYDTATNGRGRLASVSSSVSTYGYSEYDPLGRVKVASETLGSQAYSLSYTYDLASHVKSIVYPSLHAVAYNYDGAGRLGDKDAQNLAFTGNLGDGLPRNYSTGISYSPFGGLAQEQFGTTTPIYNKRHYNNRKQLWDMRASTVNNDANWNRGAIVLYYSAVNGYSGGTTGPDDNGNVLRAQTWIPGDDQISTWTNSDDWYTYDSLNRLTSITEYPNNGSSAVFKQQYNYDRWGNRTIDQANTWGGVNSMQAAVVPNTTTNRMYAPGETEQNHPLIDYDAAGNQTKDYYTWNGTRNYDGENQMISANNGATAVYSYDGDGRRVKRNVGGTETWQVYGIDGELLAEYPANTSPGLPNKEYGYRNGELLIVAEPAGGNGSSACTPSSGLVGCWKLNENSGTTTADASANGNTGTLTSGTTWAPGHSGSAASFDGVNDYVQVGPKPNLVMTNAASFSAWIYPTGAGSDGYYGGIIVNKEGEYEIARFADGTIEWAFANTNPGWAWINTGYVAPLNQWSHVVVTYDNGVIKTYANGTLTHTYSGSGGIGDVDGVSNDFRVGGRQGYSQYFQGRIDEVRVYNRVLTASEIQTVYLALSLRPNDTNGSVVADNLKLSSNSGTDQSPVLLAMNEEARPYNSNYKSTEPISDTPFKVGSRMASGVRSKSRIVPEPQGSGYTYQRTITIDHNKVSNTDQSNFPVLLSGTYSYLASSNGGNVQNTTTQTGGGASITVPADAIFTLDSACSNKLSWEWETYDPSSGAGNVWVRVPTLSATTDTPIYLCYGNSTVTTWQGYSNGSPWNSNYRGVWHLPNGVSLSTADSTTNGNNSSTNYAAAGSGKIDGAASYNGSGQYTVISNPANFDYDYNQPFSLEFWMKNLYDSSRNQVLISKNSIYWNGPGYQLWTWAGGEGLEFDLKDSANNWYGLGAQGVQDNVWHHIVVTFDGSSNYAGMEMYVDGTLRSSGWNNPISNTIRNSYNLTLGANAGNLWDFYNGSLDEVRISNSARSADWAKTVYNNQNSPSTFYTISDANSGGGGGGYHASTDFSGTQGYRNWYYLESTGASMTYSASNGWWQGSETYSLLWPGGGHPGNAVDSVLRWQAPSSGTIHITGNAYDGDVRCGDGVIVSIKKGTQTLWQQTIDNGNSTGFNYNLTTNVGAGDQIKFQINARSNNSCDSTGFDPTIAYVNGGNQSPIANAGGPYSGTIGNAVTFNGGGSYDPENGPLSYAWTFGNGGTASVVSPTHTYTSEGIYTVALTVTDNGLAQTTSTTSATICTTNSSGLVICNHGFESPSVGSGAGSYVYNPGGLWTFAGASGISGNGSGFTSGNPNAPEGSQVAFLQGGNYSVISQSISGWQANTNYTITFAATQRANCCNDGGQDFQVYLDNTQLGANFHPNSTSYTDYSTPAFTTTAGAHTLKFVGLNLLGGDHSAFIDNVRVTSSSPTPTPTPTPTPAPASSNIHWIVTDHLGTPRMIFDQSGLLTNVNRHDYLPFGEEIGPNVGSRTPQQGYTGDSVRQKFTLKERDVETGLDYFINRYYSSTQGRFTSPDEFTGGPEEVGILGSGHPEKQALKYAEITNPQSLNKYQYAFNNPLRYVDPDGQSPQDGLEAQIRADEKAFAEGRISKEEFLARARARGVGGAIGALAVAAVIGGQEIGAAILMWAAANPDKVEQIASVLQETAGGPPGMISGVGTASKAEWSIAQKLAGEGKNVEIVTAQGAARTADFVVNGIKTELKTLEGVGGAATSGTVKNAIGRALGQSGTVIIDARNVKLTAEAAQHGAARAFRADKRLQVVRIIGKDYDFTAARH